MIYWFIHTILKSLKWKSESTCYETRCDFEESNERLVAKEDARVRDKTTSQTNTIKEFYRLQGWTPQRCHFIANKKSETE